MLAENGGYSAETFDYMLLHMWMKIKELLQQGCNVNLDGVRFSLQATGTLPYANSDFDPERNRVVARATINHILRDAPRTKATGSEDRAKTPLLKPVNTLPRSPSSTNLLVQDTSLCEEKVITVPSKILIAGDDMLITPGRPDEGVQLISRKDGAVHAARILKNDGSSIDVELDNLPPAGEYTLLVRARNGNPLTFAPREMRCIVKVDPDRKSPPSGKVAKGKRK